MELLSMAVTINKGDRGADDYDRQKGAEPDRQHVGSRVRMRRMMLSMSQESSRRARSDVSTSPEIRERYQPHRCQPAAADFYHPSGAGRVLLRGAPNVQLGERATTTWVRRPRRPMSPIFSRPRTGWRSPRRLRASAIPSCDGASSIWSSKSPTTNSKGGFGGA